MSSKVTPLKNTNFIIGKSKSTVKDPVIISETLRIPEPIYLYMLNHPDFQWFIYGDQKEHDEFAALNPQFKPENRIKLSLNAILKMPLNNRPVAGKRFTFDGVFGTRRNN